MELATGDLLAANWERFAASSRRHSRLQLRLANIQPESELAPAFARAMVYPVGDILRNLSYYGKQRRHQSATLF